MAFSNLKEPLMATFNKTLAFTSWKSVVQQDMNVET